jgi:hypothetical protein
MTATSKLLPLTDFDQEKSMPFAPAYIKFVARHSKDGPGIYDSTSRCELFPDGAKWNGPKMGASARDGLDFNFGIEPPTGEPLLRLRHRYVSLRLHDEVVAFQAAKEDYQRAMNWHVQYDSCPPPPEGAEECLAAGQRRIAKLQKQLKAIDRELDSLPDAVARRAYEESKRQQYLTHRQRFSRIAAITADGGKGEEQE